jgi:hypothetical protein
MTTKPEQPDADTWETLFRRAIARPDRTVTAAVEPARKNKKTKPPLELEPKESEE